MNSQRMWTYDFPTPNNGIWRFGKQWQKRAVKRHSQQGNNPRPQAPNLSIEHFPSLDVFRWTQFINSWSGARNEICDSIPPAQNSLVSHEGYRLRSQTRVVEEIPKTIGIAGEVMSGLCRTHAGIDAHKQHT